MLLLPRLYEWVLFYNGIWVKTCIICFNLAFLLISCLLWWYSDWVSKRQCEPNNLCMYNIRTYSEDWDPVKTGFNLTVLFAHWPFKGSGSGVVSSPEHQVLKVTYCGQWMSIVRRQQLALKPTRPTPLCQLTWNLVGSIGRTCIS